MTKKIETAVILVAGEGKRLRPFTNTNPKCFASVNGKRILDNALESFAAHGCREVRIVTGHLAGLVRDTITENFAGMTIRYINNPDYATTNSMFSLAMGLEGLDSGTWVLEGDVFFAPSILKLYPPPDIAWFVDSATRQLDGAYVEANRQNRALSLRIIRDLKLLQPNQHKSIGMLCLTHSGVRQLQNWLQHGIATGRQNDYYDLILGDHMHDAAIQIVDVAGHRWFEIDNYADLESAAKVFA